MSKRAIILAGGKGTRLRPYTVVLPKPLMPVGEHPILEVIVKQLVYVPQGLPWRDAVPSSNLFSADGMHT